MLVEGVAEGEVVVVFEAHAAEDDHVDFGLHGDAREQFVVGFAGDGEDRELLGFDERVEDVDHRDAGADHLAGDDALRRVHGGAADLDHVVADLGTAVTRDTGAGEDAAEESVGSGDAHRVSEEADLVAGVDAARAVEDLEEDLVVEEADDLGEGGAAGAGDFGEVVVRDAVGLDGDDVARDLDDFMVNFTHLRFSP